MSSSKGNKLKNLYQSHSKDGSVLLASHLVKNGYSHDLINQYVRSGWLKAIGGGAYIKPNDNVNWEGALYSINKFTDKNIFVGGHTALNLQGFAHYLRHKEPVFLYLDQKTNVPSWFKNHKWDSKLEFVRTSLLDCKLGIDTITFNGFLLNVSTPERAILEYLYLCPGKRDLVEGYYLMENLPAMRDELLQSLLESCNSIKVKRLFLFMAKRLYNLYFEKLDLSRINIGSGDRNIVVGGVYDSEFKITVPQEIFEI